MKKIFVSLMLLFAVMLSLSVCAHAEARIDYVNDYAGILTLDEQKELRDRAAALSDQYDCGVYLVVVYDYTQYVNGSIEDFSEEIFHSYGLGYGDTEDGVILAMSMKERDFDIYAHGDFGNYAFTDYGKEQLADSFLDNFRQNDWFGGFRDYIETSGEMMRKAKDGNPVDIWIPDPVEQRGPGFDGFKAAISLAIGALFGGGAVGGMKRSMKTAVKQTRAEEYVARGGVKLRGKSDTFVNRSISRQVIHRESSSSSRPSGGHFGGTTISGSHGGSHHSGKF